jgi:hypothetical protein
MRSIFLAMLLALGLGAMASSSASAAPVSGAAIIDAAGSVSVVDNAQWSRRWCRWVVRRFHRPSSRVRFVRVYRCWHRGRRW